MGEASNVGQNPCQTRLLLERRDKSKGERQLRKSRWANTECDPAIVLKVWAWTACDLRTGYCRVRLIGNALACCSATHRSQRPLYRERCGVRPCREQTANHQPYGLGTGFGSHLPGEVGDSGLWEDIVILRSTRFAGHFVARLSTQRPNNGRQQVGPFCSAASLLFEW